MTKNSLKHEEPTASERSHGGGSKKGSVKNDAKKPKKAGGSMLPIQVLIMQNAKAGSKVAIGLWAIMYGGLGVYLMGAIVVVCYPQVMTWLGLEPFIEYLIQAQIEGYKNIAQLSSFQFADYFFYFHAASMLLVGAINAVFIVFLAATLSKLSDIFPDMYSKDYRRVVSPQISGTWAERSGLVFSAFSLFVAGAGCTAIATPNIMGYETSRGTITADSFGIGFTIVTWIGFCYFFQWLMINMASAISHYYWPNPKWFNRNKKEKHKSINPTQQNNKDEG